MFEKSLYDRGRDVSDCAGGGERHGFGVGFRVSVDGREEGTAPLVQVEKGSQACLLDAVSRSGM